ncbi:hypothetical protein RIF29_18391 [Crotalaria pallida]|uniref:inorganic diphosphatase n=1 Tax=Crotalaria pallida TaxID=3830 RepID=A0AAN9IHB4_CROPI
MSSVKQIGERQRKIGEVLRVKPLAALAMIDEGELDRKIVAILLNDPKASLVNDVDDVEKHVHRKFIPVQNSNFDIIISKFSANFVLLLDYHRPLSLQQLERMKERKSG